MEISYTRNTRQPKVEVRFRDPAEAQVFGGHHYSALDPRLFYWTRRVADLVSGHDQQLELRATKPRLLRTAETLLAIELDTAPALYTPHEHIPTGAARERGYDVARKLGRQLHHFLTPDLESLDR